MQAAIAFKTNQIRINWNLLYPERECERVQLNYEYVGNSTSTI